jgi:hypothetical protein
MGHGDYLLALCFLRVSMVTNRQMEMAANDNATR